MIVALDGAERQARIPPTEVTTHRHENMTRARVTLPIDCGLHQAVGEAKDVGGVGEGVGRLALNGITFKIETRGGAVAALKKRLATLGMYESGG